MTGTEFHPSLETMERYLDEALPDFEQGALEDHLAECAECTETLHRMDALLFSGFTAKSHAAAIAAEEFQADPLANALRAAQQVYAQYANTLRGWLDSAAALWEASPASPWGERGVVPVHSQPDTPLQVTLQAGETRATVHVHRTAMTVIVTLQSAERRPGIALSQTVAAVAALATGRGRGSIPGGVQDDRCLAVDDGGERQPRCHNTVAQKNSHREKRSAAILSGEG